MGLKIEIFNYIANLSGVLAAEDKKMFGSKLASNINKNFPSKPEYNEKGRGIFKVISAAFKHFEKQGKQNILNNIANSFTKKNKELAWK